MSATNLDDLYVLYALKQIRTCHKDITCTGPGP